MRESTSNGTSGGSVGPDVHGWSTPEPAWKEAASASERWTVMIGAGLGVLGCLAVGAALWRSLSGPLPEAMCADGAACNAAGANYARAPDAQEEDLLVAARLFQRGCELGFAPACNNLGLAHENASGVPRDHQRAMLAFERACSGGFAEGCSNLGTLYERGLGVRVNLGDAQRAYNQACRRGSALGCSNLGVLYAEGRGVPADEAMASRLFAEACKGGSDVGCDNLFQIEHQVTGRNFR